MRFTTAYYLVLLYVTVMFKPLIPLIGDAWSHIFNEAEHVGTVHAIYGKNHLDNSLAKEGAENDRKNHNTVKSEEPTPVHVSADECSYDFSVTAACKIFYHYFNNNLPRVLISKIAPPPKFS